MNILQHIAFLTGLFLLLVYFPAEPASHKICVASHRGCPPDYPGCRNGRFCCKENFTICDVRTSWSRLTSFCEPGLDPCPTNKYCGDRGKCVPREISICDQYLAYENASKCSEFLTEETYDLCEKFYLNNYSEDSREISSVMMCAESCIQHEIANIMRNKPSCDELKHKTFLSYSMCFPDCRVCLAPNALPMVFERIGYYKHYPDLVDNLAVNCRMKFESIREEVTANALKNMIYEFINKTEHITHKDMSAHFVQLLTSLRDSSVTNIDSNSSDKQDFTIFALGKSSPWTLVLGLLFVLSLIIIGCLAVIICQRRPHIYERISTPHASMTSPTLPNSIPPRSPSLLRVLPPTGADCQVSITSAKSPKVHFSSKLSSPGPSTPSSNGYEKPLIQDIPCA